MASVQLPAGEVHSWCVSLEAVPEACARLHTTLSPDERERSARFRFERDRRRFIVARGALRELLGRYRAVPPGQIRFVYNAFGKPALGPEFAGLKFNLSHSADVALIALARDADIGVDVEYVRPDPAYMEIARCFFSAAEVEELNTVPEPERTEAFFKCWTRKEACAKAGGEGIAASQAPPAGRWSLHTFLPVQGYVAAVAVAGGGWRLRPRFLNLDPTHAAVFDLTAEELCDAT